AGAGVAGQTDDQALDRRIRQGPRVAELLSGDAGEQRLERHAEVLGGHRQDLAARGRGGFELLGSLTTGFPQREKLPIAPAPMPLRVQEHLELQEEDLAGERRPKREELRGDGPEPLAEWEV